MLATGRTLSVSRILVALRCLPSVIAFLVVGCGGGGSSGSPPPQDFSLSVSPFTISMTVGTIGPAVAITVSGHNGFADSVNVAITGLPPGATSSPAAPFTVSPFGSQQVLLFIPPTAQTGSLSIQFDATSGSHSHSATLTLTITPVSDTAVLQEVSGQVAASTIEIQGLSAGNFNPDYWQKNTLNWVPDVRVPMLAPQPGPFQNIYSPWPLEQVNGWRMFYGGWDGTATSNDRVYSVTTSDFLSFNDHQLVIDHGDFLHVNNVNVTQLPDGSMHMICTIALTQTSNDKPAYFFSPDGVIWNGSPEPYSAQLSDVVSIPNDPLYAGYDYNGGNVLFRENGSWTLYYSVGIYGGIGKVYRATSVFPPVFQAQGVALATLHYANDVKKFQVGGKNWYLMALYVEWATNISPPTLSYSLSNDGVTFEPEHALFGGAFPLDQYPITPAFLTRGDQILGVLYGADPNTTDFPDAQIFARWLQKKVVITDSSGVQYITQSAYGPDRQWFPSPASGFLEGTMVVYAEDGITPLGSSLASLTAGKVYTLFLK